MMEEKKLVPKRRFVGFDKEWQESKLGDVVNYIVDNRGKNPSYYCNEGIPIIDNFMIKNIPYPNLNEAVRYIDENLYVNFIREYNELNDVLITLVGNGIGNITLFPNKKSAIIQNTLGLRFNENKKFMFYLMLSINKEIILLNRGMAQPNIRQDELLDINIKIPFTNEQQKIGEFFKVLDERIANQERKIAKVKALKTAYLTEMFPQEGESVPKRRFKGFTEEWKYRKLSDLTELYVGNSFSSDINNKGKYVVMDMGSVSQEGYRLKQKRTNLKRDILNKDDLVMPKDDIGGGQIIGKTAHINKNNSYVLGDHVFRLRFFDNEGLFMHYHINSKPINLSLKKKVTGSAQLGIKSINVLNQYITIPTIEEQQKIGSFFKNIDDQIATEEKKLEKLKKMKEAYLEEMFV